MGIPKSEWLPAAKRLAIGMQVRVYHGRERRPNMVVGNTTDRYWAYCQACKIGGVEMKEHVRLLDSLSPEHKCSNLVIPTDMVQVLGSEYERAIGGFLVRKGMDWNYLPEVWYSPSRKRIMLHTDSGWLGRDITDTAKEKWLTYNGTKYLSNGKTVCAPDTVVVEDAFSYFKVGWALKLDTRFGIMCALGTRLKPTMQTALLKKSRVFFMFDGDSAGWDGAEKAAAKMRTCGVYSQSKCAPIGLDPKDMTISEIRNHIIGVQQ